MTLSIEPGVPYVQPESSIELRETASQAIGVVAAANAIVEAHEIDRTVDDLEIYRGGDVLSSGESSLRDNFMALRLHYVTALGWRDGLTDDTDQYDNLGSTLTFVKSKGGIDPSIVCGMRMTAVNSLEDSLTWHMLDNTSGVQSTITAEHASRYADMRADAEAGKLWDLTRLTPQLDGSAGPAEISRGIHELLGAALARTSEYDGTEPTWFFLTTDTFKRFLDTSGIEHDVLYSGMVSEGDQEVSHLCVTNPAQALRSVQASSRKTHQRTAASVLRGYAKAID